MNSEDNISYGFCFLFFVGIGIFYSTVLDLYSKSTKVSFFLGSAHNNQNGVTIEYRSYENPVGYWTIILIKTVLALGVGGFAVMQLIPEFF